ncbi:MAG: dockerin type I repeat-containing protein, partial [Candidatus Bipolaricaulota bacterium]|nr:dockerin type I repeat-containing protein [Candidatus Bipolaricaulota bacterium]
FDPEIIEILSIKGVGPYTVNSVNIDSLAGRAQFTVTLKPGRTALNEGVIAEIEIDKAPDAPVGVSVDLLIESEDGIEIVDVFRDRDGRDLIPDVMPGRVTIKLLKGDVDKDNVVTMSDARLVARFVLGLETLAPEQEEAADVAPPIGVIDATDVRWIAQAAAGLRKFNNSLYSAVALSDRERPTSDRVRASAQMRSGRLEFRVADARASETLVRIFALSGAPVLTASAAGATVRLSEAELAQLPNGVYLYTVTTLSPDGRWHQSQLEKLIVLR